LTKPPQSNQQTTAAKRYENQQIKKAKIPSAPPLHNPLPDSSSKQLMIKKIQIFLTYSNNVFDKKDYQYT
jgi:hypothetical protein